MRNLETTFSKMRIRSKKLITNIVLGVTTLVLTAFFFYIKAYKNGIVSFSSAVLSGLVNRARNLKFNLLKNDFRNK